MSPERHGFVYTFSYKSLLFALFPGPPPGVGSPKCKETVGKLQGNYKETIGKHRETVGKLQGNCREAAGEHRETTGKL